MNLLGQVDLPKFDSVTISDNYWNVIKDQVAVEKDASIYFGVEFIVRKYVPDNMMILAQSGKIVSIVRFDTAPKTAT